MLFVLIIGCGADIPVAFHHYTMTPYTVTTQPRVIPVWVDVNFGQADRVAIYDALLQWNYALNDHLRFDLVSTPFNMQMGVLQDIVDRKVLVFIKVDSKHPLVAQFNKKDERTIAWADRIGGSQIFIIRDRAYNDWIMGLAMHEMGHVLGSKHTGDYLMHPHFHYLRTKCIDYDTLKEVAAYQHFKIEELNYCWYSNQ